MAFILEDGTGLTNSTSYVSLAEADSYFEDGDNSTWAGLSSAQKQTALIKGTRYLDRTFKYPGLISDDDQALKWPRLYAYNNDLVSLDAIVPQEIKDMTCEAAVRSVSDDLIPDITNPGFIKRERIYDAVEIEYAYGASQKKAYTVISQIGYSSGIITGTYGSGNQLSIVRV